MTTPGDPVDDRIRIPLGGKVVNLAQLAAEVGAALSASDTEIVVADLRAGVSEAAVRAALAAHVADPDFGIAPEDKQARAARAKALQVFAGTATFTPAEVQKILAAVVLRATR